MCSSPTVYSREVSLAKSRKWKRNIRVRPGPNGRPSGRAVRWRSLSTGDAIISTRLSARALKFFMAATSLFRTASHQGVWKEQKARTRRVSVYSGQEPSLLSTRVDSAFSAFHGCSLEGSPFSRAEDGGGTRPFAIYSSRGLSPSFIARQ